MAEYKLSSMDDYGSKLRTNNYRFTVTSRDDPHLAALRKEVKRNNKAMRALARQTGHEYYANYLKRVRLMPRGPRVEAAWSDYRSRRAYDSYLPMRHATHFDVYVQQDDKAYQLIQELRYGITPGVRAKIDEQCQKIWDLENEFSHQMHQAGFYKFNDKWMTREAAANAMDEEGYPDIFVERVRNG